MLKTKKGEKNNYLALFILLQFNCGCKLDDCLLENHYLQLWSIYAAGNTVPIPFLKATDISPIALLSDNVLGGAQWNNGDAQAVETLQELFTGDGPSKKGRRVQNEVVLLSHSCVCIWI